jgi:Glycerol kinase
VYCLEEKELKKVKATLLFAKKVGLIDDESFSALEKRRMARNIKNQEMIEKGELVYGLISYSAPVYQQYELTRFKLDFAEETDEIKKKYTYHAISEEQKRNFYSDNMDLFVVNAGYIFSYEEVELIIEKRIREAEYEKNVNDILCQLS